MTMRMAIEDKIASFGPKYPKGPQHLKQLAELAKKRDAAKDGTSEQKTERRKRLTRRHHRR